jgi:Bacterial inner membrane protein
MSLFPDGLGWAATAVFAASYFFKEPAKLRLTQALAAMLWIVYGLLIHSLPVVVANLIVSSLALYSAWRGGGIADCNP